MCVSVPRIWCEYESVGTWYLCMSVYVCVFGLSARVLVHGVFDSTVEAGKRWVEGPGEVVEGGGKEERERGRK